MLKNLIEVTEAVEYILSVNAGGNFRTSVRKIGPTVLYITFYVVQHRRGFRAF
jgi:hypothetical protein